MKHRYFVSLFFFSFFPIFRKEKDTNTSSTCSLKHGHISFLHFLGKENTGNSFIAGIRLIEGFFIVFYLSHGCTNLELSVR